MKCVNININFFDRKDKTDSLHKKMEIHKTVKGISKEYLPFYHETKKILLGIRLHVVKDGIML